MLSPYLAAARGLKFCRKCQTEKPADAFPFNWEAGKVYSPCRDCNQKAQAACRARKRGGPWVHPQAWSAADSEKLRLMILAGHTSAECAAALGRSVGAVHDCRIRRGYPRFKLDRRQPRMWPPRRVAALGRLRAAGATFDQCAAKLKTTRGSIAHACATYLSRSPVHAQPLPHMRSADCPA